MSTLRRKLLVSFRLSAVIICAAHLASATPVREAHALEPVDEYALKAAFLYNFTKFVEWPATAFAESTSPFALCVLGHDPFGSSLDTLAGKTVKSHPLVIKRIQSGAPLADCHLLYVSPKELTQPEILLHRLENTQVLTVCDAESCAEAGMMLNMRMMNNRVQLDSNLDAVRHTALKMSSQLIKLTRVVKGEP